MPVFIAALIGGLVQAASSMVGRVLVALGVGVVTFSGISLLLGAAKAAAWGYLNSAAASSIGQFLGLLQVGTCMNIWFSAFAAKAAISGLSGDNVKKWITK